MSRGRFIWLSPMVGLVISGCATGTGGTAQTPPHPGGPSAGVGLGVGSGGPTVSSGVRLSPGPDPVLSSTLTGAALGALGGPIGVGVGGVAGLLYGLHERERTEKQAQSEMTRQVKIEKEFERQIEAKRHTVAQHGTESGPGLILVEDHLAPAREGPSTTATTAPSASGQGLILVTDHLTPAATSTAATPAPAERPFPAARATEEERGNAVGSRQELDARIAAARERQQKLQEALRGTPPSTGTTTVAGSPGHEARATVDPEGFRPVYEGGRLVRKERDVNGDGKPDILRYYDGTGRLTRQEEDSRLVGRLDTWTFYEEGAVRKESDTDGDGKIDLWAVYDGREHQDHLMRTEADTDHDGHRDRVTLYAKGEMAEEQHYSPGLDPAQAIITYASGQPTRKEEDTDRDGRMDRLTEYDGSGRVTKVSRNPVKAGAYALVAYYQPKTAEILREEEDLNGDGGIDIVSYYQQGRLVRREFFDLPEVAALTPQLSAPHILLPQETP